MSSRTQISLATFKAKQLQQLAFLTGINSTGTKSILISRLSTELNAAREKGHLTGTRKHETLRSAQRILSIDLGLRNLAYCLLEVHGDAPIRGKTAKGSQIEQISSPEDALARISSGCSESNVTELDKSLTSPPILQTLHLHTWRRISLLARPSNAALSVDAAQAQAFSPITLAPLAYNLINDVFLPLGPTRILVERQRYRSGGSAAVQEWTVRVNMLESMLVAMLVALQAHASGAERLPSVDSVSPKRVASFWLGGNSEELSVALKNTEEIRKDSKLKKSSSKIEKEAKIGLVDGWLRDSYSSSSFVNPEALATCEHFLRVRDGKLAGIRRKSEHVGGDRISSTDTSTKLDDLADCLLQGVAWLQWERNKQEAIQYIDFSNHGAN